MAYYNYHSRIISRIKNGELIGISASEKDGYAIIMIFSSPPHTRPIKESAMYRYSDINNSSIQRLITEMTKQDMSDIE